VDVSELFHSSESWIPLEVATLVKEPARIVPMMIVTMIATMDTTPPTMAMFPLLVLRLAGLYCSGAVMVFMVAHAFIFYIVTSYTSE